MVIFILSRRLLGKVNGKIEIKDKALCYIKSIVLGIDTIPIVVLRSTRVSGRVNCIGSDGRISTLVVRNLLGIDIPGSISADILALRRITLSVIYNTGAFKRAIGIVV